MHGKWIAVLKAATQPATHRHLLWMLLLLALGTWAQSANSPAITPVKPPGIVPQPGELVAAIDTDRMRAYVGEQILLSLEVVAPAEAFNITGTSLQVSHATLQSLDRQQSILSQDGRSYQHTRTVYAVFANKPGALMIPALNFKATLPVSPASEDDSVHSDDRPFDAHANNRNPILATSSSSLTLTIDAPPPSADPWFAARQVDLSSNWSVDPVTGGSIIAGEPVIRHITVDVYGQYPAAIPPLDIPVPDGLRAYADRSQMDTYVTPDGLNGTRKLAIALVPSQAGQFELPEVVLRWWNIETQQWQASHLPAEQLKAVPADRYGTAVSGPDTSAYRYALAISALTSTALALLCLMLWRRNRALIVHSSTLSASKRISQSNNEKTSWVRLQQDFRNEDLRAIRQSTLRWINSLMPERNISTLEQIAMHYPALSEPLYQLDLQLYGHRCADHHFLHSLQLALGELRRKPPSFRESSEPLPNLYPENDARGNGAQEATRL